MSGRLARLGKVAGAVAATAGLGGLASSEVRTDWYAAHEKPSFQPPDAAFPVAWTTLYTDIALSAASSVRPDRSNRSRACAAVSAMSV